MLREATFIAAAAVFGIGLYGVLTRRDMVKICVCLSVMESSLIMTLVALAYLPGGAAPIIEAGVESYVDPIPHALALTAIVIGAGVLSVALALTVLVHRRYGTTDIGVAFRRRR
ncbi:MAG: sodium:proton antiporter [Alkalispirochaetaceae bacterium]